MPYRRRSGRSWRGSVGRVCGTGRVESWAAGLVGRPPAVAGLLGPRRRALAAGARQRSALGRPAAALCRQGRWLRTTGKLVLDCAQRLQDRSSCWPPGGDKASTAVAKSAVHAERVVTLVNQSLQLAIVANDENYALAA